MREQPPVRPAFDLSGALQYTSFWWRPGDKQCFGFVLTPLAGENLRRTIRSQEAGGGDVRLHAMVKSSFRNGHMDVVSVLIPGQTDEEVLVVAHICHPQPSANDNASGVGTVLEAARVLSTAIDAQRLAQPRRGIRFLLPPEIYGTYAYLASDERRMARTVAAINLDMVGENQELCGSSFLVERLPQAMAAPMTPWLLPSKMRWRRNKRDSAALAPMPSTAMLACPSTAAATTLFYPILPSAFPVRC